MPAPEYATQLTAGTPVVITFKTEDGATDTRQGIWERAGRGDGFWTAVSGPGAGYSAGMAWEHILSITPVAQ